MTRYTPSLCNNTAFLATLMALACACGPDTGMRDPLRPEKQGLIAEPRLLHRYLQDASDSSAYAHPGAIIGAPGFQPGCIDRGIVLDGAGDHVSVQNSDALQPAMVSVEIYFKPSALLTDGSTFVPLVVKLPEGSSFGNTVDGYDLAYQDPFGTGGRIGFGIGSQGGAVRVNASATMAIGPDRFHHVVGTYDRKAMRLYVDGLLVATTPYTQPIVYLGGPVQIGGNIPHHLILPFGARGYFGGNIEEVSIYGRALDAHEIAQRAKRCNGLGQTPAGTPPPPGAAVALGAP